MASLGRSFAQCLTNPRADARQDLYLAYTDLHRGVTDGHRKLIEYVVNGQRTTQLFDLDSDPDEINNLAAAETSASDLERLRARLVDWRQAIGDDKPQGKTFWAGYGE